MTDEASFRKLMMWVIIFLLLVVFVAILVSLLMTRTPKSQVYEFSKTGVVTDRNGLLTVDYDVSYRFNSEDEANHPDQSDIEDLVDTFLVVSDDVPAGASWPTVAKEAVKKVYDDYNVKGVHMKIILPDGHSAVYNKGSLYYTVN